MVKNNNILAFPKIHPVFISNKKFKIYFSYYNIILNE